MNFSSMVPSSSSAAANSITTTAAAATATTTTPQQQQQQQQQQRMMMSSNSSAMLPQQLAQALQSIPVAEKVELLHALRVAPHLVETESNPTSFLRFCDWNVVAAARRLAVYWRMRQDIFGTSRAFLPLWDLSGTHGALGPAEIQVVQSGAYSVMPVDTHGRAVGVGDRDRIPFEYRKVHAVKLRALFVMFNQVAQNVLSQTLGAAFLLRGLFSADKTNITKQAQELLLEAFPIKVHSLHLLYARQERGTFQQAIIPFLAELFSRFIVSKIHVHNCDSVEQLLSNLAQHGIPRESVPLDFGGTASYVASSSCAALPLSTSVDVAAVGGGDFASLGSSGGGTGAEHNIPSVAPPLAALIGGGNSSGTTQQVDNTGTAAPLFSKVLDNMASFGADDSPFEPRPIRPLSQQKQQQQQNILHEQEETSAESRSNNAISADPRPPRQIWFATTTSDRAATPNSGTNITAGSTAASAFSLDDTTVVVPFVETPDMHKRSLAALNDAMKAIPGDEQEAYQAALRTAPAVVETESVPLNYLRFEKFNAWAAAIRLTHYWKYRVEYFGEKAFLPLTQTEAMWDEDFSTLSSGSFSFLPPDAKGRPVLCCDPSKHPENASEASRIRVAMYFFAMLWHEYPAAMTEGCIILVFVPTKMNDMSKFDDTTRKATDIVLDSFPIKHCETHVIYSPPTTSSPLRSFTAMVLPVLQRALGRLLSQDRAHFHVAGTPDELRGELSSVGLSGACLQAAVDKGMTFQQQKVTDTAPASAQAQLLLGQRSRAREEEPSALPSPPAVAVADDGASGNDVATSWNRQGSSAKRVKVNPAPESKDLDSAMELVPAVDKQAYLEAMEKVPELVKKESDATRFLKAENNDALAAARRLATYWRIRREIFNDRAFLPMDQTTDGALDRRDVTVLQTGFLSQLPNDDAGNSVVCCDGSWLEKASVASQFRVFFYLWSVLSQNERSQTDGYTMLYAMTKPGFDRACKSCLDLAMQAHPVKLKSFHLLGCCPVDTNESEFRQGAVRSTMVQLLGPSVHEKVVLHVCGSQGGFANKLAVYGMPKAGLPKSYGGEWGLDDFVQWQELRVRHEWNLPIGLSVHKVAHGYGIPTPVAPTPASLSDAEKTERQRRLNVVHSRRTRGRARIEIQVMQEQCRALRNQQEELLREGRELEELLRKAEAIVAPSMVGSKDDDTSSTAKI